MKVYIQNPKDSTRKLLELIKEFGKFSGYKINAQKFLAFLCTTTKEQKEKLRKQSHLPSHQKELKYLGINLPKETKDLYSKNTKMGEGRCALLLMCVALSK